MAERAATAKEMEGPDTSCHPCGVHPGLREETQAWPGSAHDGDMGCQGSSERLLSATHPLRWRAPQGQQPV